MSKQKMIIVETLDIKVTYKVGLGNVEMPENIYYKLLEKCNKGDEIEMGAIGDEDVMRWINNNIEENDCYEWEAEIKDITDITDEK